MITLFFSAAAYVDFLERRRFLIILFYDIIMWIWILDREGMESFQTREISYHSVNFVMQIRSCLVFLMKDYDVISELVVFLFSH